LANDGEEDVLVYFGENEAENDFEAYKELALTYEYIRFTSVFEPLVKDKIGLAQKSGVFFVKNSQANERIHYE
jgi:hypothetical protein